MFSNLERLALATPSSFSLASDNSGRYFSLRVRLDGIGEHPGGALAVERCLGNRVSAPDGSTVRSKGSKLTTCVYYSNECYVLLYKMIGMRLFELDA